MAQQLTDGHGRRFEYLRLSLTDVCNFRCSYCLPDGYRKQAGLPASLTVRETGRLIAAFARLGLWKVRLTGGEPSLRPELLDIARTVAATPGGVWTAGATGGLGVVTAGQPEMKVELPERGDGFAVNELLEDSEGNIVGLHALAEPPESPATPPRPARRPR